MVRIFYHIRAGNLLMIAGVQALLHFALIVPFLGYEGLVTALSPPLFALLSASVACLAAGGYLLNDLQDRRVDALNRPGRVLPVTAGWTAYAVFTTAGLAAGVFLSWRLDAAVVWKVNTLAAVLLAAYSGPGRRWKFAGNLLVAALVTLSMLIVWLADPPALGVRPVRIVLYGYCFFAFFLTWSRELLKDLQDMEGDGMHGKRTLPVVAGPRVAALLAAGLLLVVFAALAWLQVKQRQWEDPLPFGYIVVLIQLPLAVLIAGTLRARTSVQYGRLSALAKGVMLTGMLSLLVFHLLYLP